jgi:hypothetical protein
MSPDLPPDVQLALSNAVRQSTKARDAWLNRCQGPNQRKKAFDLYQMALIDEERVCELASGHMDEPEDLVA